jgi:hypothetical protein
MNVAQRAILKIVLAIGGFLILRPPFELRVGGRILDLGYHWLPFWIVDGRPVRIDFASLAGEIIVVSFVGWTAVLLAKGISDDRISAFLGHFPALGRALLNLRPSGFAIFVLVLALVVSVVFLLAKIGVL